MNPLAFDKRAGGLLMTLAAISSVLFAAGCGNSNSNVTPLGGSYNNGSLSGTYVMQQTGFFETTGGGAQQFSETTVFSANGSGSLTVLEDDGGPQGPGAENLAGSYSIQKDGTGTMVFRYTGANSATANYAITMIDNSHFYVIDADTYAVSSGYGVLQSSTSAPSGTYVFKAHNFALSSRVGGINISAGSFTGTQDILELGGSNQSQTISGSVTAPGSSGVGTFTLNAPTGAASGNYYVVSPTEFFFMANPASSSLEIGQAQTQTATSFAAGTYVFGGSGDTQNNQPGVHSAGIFATDGNGNVTSGTVDLVQDSNIYTALAVSGGTYTINGSGNGTITLPLTNGPTVTEVFWMLSPTSAYFLDNSPLAVEEGSFTAQSGSVSSLSAQGAFVLDGFPGAFGGQVGDFQPTNGGNFNWNEVANSGSGGSGIGTNGNYTASGPSGRFTVAVNNFSPATNYVFYLSSPNTGFMIEEDAGAGDIGGVFAQQAGQ